MNVNFREIFSIPNIISYIRIIFMPIFVYTNVTAVTQRDYFISSVMLFLLAITDFLDGYIARKYNMVTEVGKALDPVADKLFQLAIAVCLVYKVPGMGIILVIFLIKEGVLSFCSIYYLLRYKRKMDGAMWFGKVSTAIFYTMTFLMVLLPPLHPHIYYVMEVVMAISLGISFVLYNKFFIDLHHQLKEEGVIK